MSRKVRILIILLLLGFLPATFVYSQSGQYKIRQITTKDGLLTPGVKFAYKDSKGFMWFAFSNGIARYDGYTVKRFDNFLPDSSSINPYKFCTSFLEDSKGNFWIGTLKNGLARLDRATEKFTYYNIKPGAPDFPGYNTIYCIYEDSDGILWLGTGNEGLYKFIPEADSFINFNPRTVYERPGAVVVHSLCEDRQKNFWVGTDQGFFIFDKKKGIFTLIPVPAEPGMPDRLKEIRHIKEDKSGDIWLGTTWGAYRYNPIGKTWKYYFTGMPGKLNDFLGGNVYGITEVETGKTHQMWIGTGSGLLIYDFGTELLEPFEMSGANPQSAVIGGVKSVYLDDNNMIWISQDGIELVDPEENPFRYKRIFSYPDSLSEVSAWTILEDKEGMIWVGTFNDGLYLFDSNLNFVDNYKPTVWGKSKPHIISKNRITLLYEDSERDLWVGTSGDGLSVFDRKKKSFTTVFFEKQSGKIELLWVFDVLEDNHGVLWFATQAGLFKTQMPWKSSQSILPVSHPLLANTSVADLYLDSRNRLWVVTFNQGVFCLTDENRESLKFKRYFHQSYNRELFTNKNVIEVFEDIDGGLWMHNETSLFKYDEVSDSIIPENHFQKTGEGIECYAFTGDSSGNLWIVSSKGFLRYDPGDSTDMSLKVFANSDGMFYDGFVHTIFGESKNGYIYLGGSGKGAGGLCRFNPNTVFKDNRRQPELALTDFKIHNEVARLDSSITYKKHIILNHNQNFFSFEFAALDYVNSPKNQYAYYLEGYEDDWIYSGSTRTANYTGVPPGQYIFHVKGSNNDGYWNETGTNMLVTILPPFWKTWLAYLLYFLVFAGILYSIIRFYLRRQKLVHDLYVRDLEAQKLKEVDSLKSRFFANISHEFRTPLTLILGPIEKLKSTVKNNAFLSNLNIMENNALRLQHLINQLLTLSKFDEGRMKLQAAKLNIVKLVESYMQSFESLAVRRGIELLFISKEDNIPVYVDRDKLEKILYNLLSNAFKFTGNGGRIEVEVGSPQSAVGSPQSAVGSQQSAVGSRQSAVGSPQSAVGSQQSAVSSRQSAVGSRQSAVGSR